MFSLQHHELYELMSLESRPLTLFLWEILKLRIAVIKGWVDYGSPRELFKTAKRQPISDSVRNREFQKSSCSHAESLFFSNNKLDSAYHIYFLFKRPIWSIYGSTYYMDPNKPIAYSPGSFSLPKCGFICIFGTHFYFQPTLLMILFWYW